jgi:hypothetical protein
MAGIWCLYCYWRKNGNCHFRNQALFYLYFIPYIRLAGYFLYDFGLLDEHQKLHQKFKAQSIEVSVDSAPKTFLRFSKQLFKRIRITSFCSSAIE